MKLFWLILPLIILAVLILFVICSCKLASKMDKEMEKKDEN